MGITTTWGTTTEERERAFPCDGLIDAPACYWRGVTIDAPRVVVFRWLCQLRAAPYSYDLIDNRGRRSPQQLTPGLDGLAVGQRMMFIFDLLSFQRDAPITVRMRERGLAPRLFGDVAVSYTVAPADTAGTRLVAKLAVRYPRAPLGWLMRAVLPLCHLLII